MRAPRGPSSRPPRPCSWQHGKAINVDEFANGLADAALLRRICWTIVMSGGNFHIEDPDPASAPRGSAASVGVTTRSCTRLDPRSSAREGLSA
jgi:hypothetical protein